MTNWKYPRYRRVVLLLKMRFEIGQRSFETQKIGSFFFSWDADAFEKCSRQSAHVAIANENNNNVEKLKIMRGDFHIIKNSNIISVLPVIVAFTTTDIIERAGHDASRLGGWFPCFVFPKRTCVVCARRRLVHDDDSKIVYYCYLFFLCTHDERGKTNTEST